MLASGRLNSQAVDSVVIGNLHLRERQAVFFRNPEVQLRVVTNRRAIPLDNLDNFECDLGTEDFPVAPRLDGGTPPKLPPVIVDNGVIVKQKREKCPNRGR